MVFKRATFLFATATLFASPASPVRAQADANLLFMQRLAAGFGSHADVTPGSLPKGWIPPVPLPDAPILGSLRAGPQQTVTVFFNPANAQTAADAYMNRLRAAGFTAATSFPSPQGGGFVSAAPQMRNGYLCRGNQLVSVVVPPGAVNDLRVTIQPPAGGAGMCGRLPGMFGAYAIARYTSPLPQFSAPPGTEIDGTGTNFGTGGAASSFVSTATITGKQTAAGLLNSFALQLQRAGWKITDKTAGRDAAIMTFQTSRPPTQWHGTLSLYRMPAPNTFGARVDASGEGSPPAPTVSGNINVPQISAHSVKPSDPAVIQLLKRLALNNGAGSATIYIEKAPPGLNNIPLPSVRPVGSTLVKAMANSGSPSAYTLYYDLSNAQLQSYLGRLKSSGWTSQAFPFGAMGGFGMSTLSGVAMYCKTGRGMLALSAAPPGANQVTITGATGGGAPCPVTQMQQVEAEAGFSQRSPLPQLTAPLGVVMQSGTPGIPGSPSTSGATLVTNMPLPALLDAFSAQLAKSGWIAAPSNATSSLGSRSFTLTDSNGQHWQAVMTIYQSATQPDHYYSYIDLTNLTVEGNRRLE